jgi:hypothetical protein
MRGAESVERGEWSVERKAKSGKQQSGGRKGIETGRIYSAGGFGCTIGRWRMADGGDALVGAPGGWKGLILPTSYFLLHPSYFSCQR